MVHARRPNRSGGGHSGGGRMSEQALVLRRSVQIVRRHKFTVVIAAALGLVAVVAFTVLRPPVPPSQANVNLPPATARYIGTQAVIAESDPVLLGAMRQLHPPMPQTTLDHRVQANSQTPRIITVNSQGASAA